MKFALGFSSLRLHGRPIPGSRKRISPLHDSNYPWHAWACHVWSCDSMNLCKAQNIGACIGPSLARLACPKQRDSTTTIVQNARGRRPDEIIQPSARRMTVVAAFLEHARRRGVMLRCGGSYLRLMHILGRFSSRCMQG